MKYWIKATVGLGLIPAGLAGFLYSLYELMKTRTCSSGRPYVTVRECPEGTFEKSLLIPGGVMTSLLGVAVFAFRWGSRRCPSCGSAGGRGERAGSGVLTEVEFAAAKSRILAEL